MDKRLKRTASSVAFGVVLAGLVLVLAFVLLSDVDSGVANASPPGSNPNIPLGDPSIGPLGAGSGMASLPTFSARQLPTSKRGHATISPQLLRYSLQPRLVQSFRSLSAGWVSTPVFIPAAEVAAVDSSNVPIAPIVLFGSAAGWTYLALTGGYDGGSITPGGGNPAPPASNPPTTGPPTQSDPGNNPPG